MDSYSIKILNIVNLLCPQKYNSKYNPLYYLKYMPMILRDFTSWKSLGNIFIYFKYNDIKKFHYKSIYNVFLKWSHLGSKKHHKCIICDVF